MKADEIIIEVVKSMVSEPDKLHAELMETNVSQTLVIRVTGKDYGRVIGEKGRTLHMLKDISNCMYRNKASSRDERQLRLLVGEPLDKSFGESVTFDPKIDNEVLMELSKLTKHMLLSIDSGLKLNVMDIGTNVLFEISEHQLTGRMKEITSFLIVAMCKNHGRLATVEFF